LLPKQLQCRENFEQLVVHDGVSIAVIHFFGGCLAMRLGPGNPP
jgi:hypothetical protein